MTRGIRDRDRGWKRLLKQSLANARVTVGVQGVDAEASHPGSDITNARLAGVHEFGAQIAIGKATVVVPERSFMRSTFDDNRDRYERAVIKLGRSVLAGAITIEGALRILGERAASDIKRTIEKGIDPPNAESTIARKGSSKPLIDTGVMRNAISYVVHSRGTEVSS